MFPLVLHTIKKIYLFWFFYVASSNYFYSFSFPSFVCFSFILGFLFFVLFVLFCRDNKNFSMVKNNFYLSFSSGKENLRIFLFHGNRFKLLWYFGKAVKLYRRWIFQIDIATNKVDVELSWNIIAWVLRKYQEKKIVHQILAVYKMVLSLQHSLVQPQFTFKMESSSSQSIQIQVFIWLLLLSVVLETRLH